MKIVVALFASLMLVFSGMFAHAGDHHGEPMVGVMADAMDHQTTGEPMECCLEQQGGMAASDGQSLCADCSAGLCALACGFLSPAALQVDRTAFVDLHLASADDQPASSDIGFDPPPPRV